MNDNIEIGKCKKIISNYKNELLSIPFVHGISFGYKSINGKPTTQIALIAHVHQKKDRNQLKENKLFDKVVKNIDPSIVTDVVEKQLPKEL